MICLPLLYNFPLSNAAAGEMEVKWMMTIRRSRYIGLGRWSIHDGLVRSLALLTSILDR